MVTGRFDRLDQPHLFDRFDWLEDMHVHCLPHTAPQVLCAGDGTAEAWLFLAGTAGRERVAIANWYSFAFRPIFTGNPDREQKLRLMERIARALGRDAAHVHIYPVIAEDGTADLLLQSFRKAGWMAVARPMGTSHLLQLNGRDFAAYWSARPGQLRSTVRRKLRNDALRYEIHSRFSDALWCDYMSVYRRSWKPDEASYAFLRALAQREGDAGTLRLGFARQHGFPVAAQLWTVENGVALIHKLAHDASADGASPGTMLSHYMFRSAIDTDKVTTIDYGTGDTPYKTEWMEEQRPLLRIDCFNPRFASAWLPAARTAISKLVG